MQKHFRILTSALLTATLLQGCAATMSLFSLGQVGRSSFVLDNGVPDATPDQIKILLVRENDWRLPKMLLNAGLGFGIEAGAGYLLARSIGQSPENIIVPVAVVDSLFVALFAWGDSDLSKRRSPGVWVEYRRNDKVIKQVPVPCTTAGDGRFSATVDLHAAEQGVVDLQADDVRIISSIGTLFTTASNERLSAAVHSATQRLAAEQNQTESTPATSDSSDPSDTSTIAQDFLQAYSKVVDPNFQGEKTVEQQFQDGFFIGKYHTTGRELAFRKAHMTLQEAKAVCRALGVDPSQSVFTKTPTGLSAKVTYTAVSGASVVLVGNGNEFSEVDVSTFWD